MPPPGEALIFAPTGRGGKNVRGGLAPTPEVDVVNEQSHMRHATHRISSLKRVIAVRELRGC